MSKVYRRYSAKEKADLMDQALDLRGEAHAWSAIAKQLGVPFRTMQDWRMKDDRFRVACAAADGQGTQFLVESCRELAFDEKTPPHQRAIMLMFLVKQRDPSFRENHKVEHVVGGGLQAALDRLAQLGAE